MLIPVNANGEFENKKAVRDYFRIWICEGMYVNEVSCLPGSKGRQGWVTEVKPVIDGFGRIKVQVVKEAGVYLDEQSYYITEFEQGTNWCKAIVDG